jgi:hypothetical protein
MSRPLQLKCSGEVFRLEPRPDEPSDLGGRDLTEADAVQHFVEFLDRLEPDLHVVQRRELQR